MMPKRFAIATVTIGLVTAAVQPMYSADSKPLKHVSPAAGMVKVIETLYPADSGYPNLDAYHSKGKYFNEFGVTVGDCVFDTQITKPAGEVLTADYCEPSNNVHKYQNTLHLTTQQHDAIIRYVRGRVGHK